ncbi:MAG: Lrp/AsnC family transcriptional regulator, partial [Methanoregula sp.]
MDSLDIRLLRELEHGLPLIPEPFEEIGNRLGLTGLEVQERIRNLKSSGIVRKFTARVNQRLAGISANALVAWRPADPSHRD